MSPKNCNLFDISRDSDRNDANSSDLTTIFEFGDFQEKIRESAAAFRKSKQTLKKSKQTRKFSKIQ